jgi:hypothetical protein
MTEPISAAKLLVATSLTIKIPRSRSDTLDRCIIGNLPSGGKNMERNGKEGRCSCTTDIKSTLSLAKEHSAVTTANRRGINRATASLTIHLEPLNQESKFLL